VLSVWAKRSVYGPPKPRGLTGGIPDGTSNTMGVRLTRAEPNGIIAILIG
jgi:hypothetical protein